MGARVGHYELLQELGRGGMGVVYRARDLELGRDVALKTFTTWRPDREDLERFEREALALGKLASDPHVAQIHQVGSWEGRPYLVMELIEGTSLAERLRSDGPLGLEPTLELVQQVCAGLEGVHAAGVIHRDLKPGNVVVTPDGRATLIDFGLALVRDARTLTQSGDLLGTPSYMAPEQVEGDRAAIGPATDVYAVGALTYALLTGEPPFQGATVVNVLNLVLAAKPPVPSALRPELPAWVDQVVVRCLAKEPSDRYPSVGALRQALTGASPPPRRGPGAVAGLAAIALAAAALGLWSVAPARSRDASGPDLARSSPAAPERPSPSVTSSRAVTPEPSEPPKLPSEHAADRALAAATFLVADPREDSIAGTLGEPERIGPAVRLGPSVDAVDELEDALLDACRLGSDPGRRATYRLALSQLRLWWNDREGARAHLDAVPTARRGVLWLHTSWLIWRASTPPPQRGSQKIREFVDALSAAGASTPLPLRVELSLAQGILLLGFPADEQTEFVLAAARRVLATEAATERESVWAWTLICAAERVRGNYLLARRAGETALQLEDQLPRSVDEAWEAMLNLFLELGDRTQAVRCLAEVNEGVRRQAAPKLADLEDTLEATLHRLRAEARTATQDERLDLWARGCALQPDDDAFFVLRAKAFFERGDVAAALRECAAGPKDSPELAAIRRACEERQ